MLLLQGKCNIKCDLEEEYDDDEEEEEEEEEEDDDGAASSLTSKSIPLIVAAMADDTDTATSLLKQGAKVNQRDS